MAQNYEDVQLIKEDNQFQFHIDGLTAFINYALTGKDLVLIHTEVPEQLEGKGVAAALVEKTLAYAEHNSLKIIPKCTYILAFLKKHPEWNRVVDRTR